MFHYAALCFGITIATALMGFGPVGTELGALGAAVALTKALAVVFLLLFFVSLYRGLYTETKPGNQA